MWGVKSSVIPGVITALGAGDHQAGWAAPADPTSAQDCHASRPLAKDHTWKQNRPPVLFPYIAHSLLPMVLKYLSHFHNCHISLAVERVLLFSQLRFLLPHIHLIILFNSSLSLLEWHSVTAASPVAFVLSWRAFLPASVLREAQTIIFLMTYLPGTNRETSDVTWQLLTKFAAMIA